MKVTILIAALTALWFGIVFTHTGHHFTFDDFLVFSEAGELARAKQSVYLFQVDWPAGYKFKYSPFAAVFYGFLFPADVEVASWTHLALSVLAWGAIFIWACRQISRPSWPIILVTLGAFAFPIRDELKMGQCNGFVALAVLIAVTQTRRVVWAGGMLAFAVLLKTYAALVIPWLLFRRELRLTLSTMIWCLVLGLGIPAAVAGFAHAVSEHVRWFEILTQSTEGLLMRADNASLLSFVGKASQDVMLGRVVWVAAVLAFLAGSWRLRNAQTRTGFAWWGSMVLPLTPLSWPYWNLMALPAALGALHRARARGPWRTGGVAILLFACMNKVNGTWLELGFPLAGCLVLGYSILTSKSSTRRPS